MRRPTRIYGSKKGELFVSFPEGAISLRKIKVQYYLTSSDMKTIEGHNFREHGSKIWTFQFNDHQHRICETKKKRMKLFLHDGDKVGFRIAGVWNIPMLHARPKKLERKKHEWNFDADQHMGHIHRYDYKSLWRLKDGDLSGKRPVLIIL